MNRTSRRVRLVWIGVIALALIGIAAAARRALVLLFGIDARPATQGLDAAFARHRVPTFIHIIPGVRRVSEPPPRDRYSSPSAAAGLNICAASPAPARLAGRPAHSSAARSAFRARVCSP